MDTITVKITHILAGPGEGTYAEAEMMARLELPKFSPVIDGVPKIDEMEAAQALLKKVRTSHHKNAITRAFTFLVP